jgi:uncharacterized membrane protein YfcA
MFLRLFSSGSAFSWLVDTALLIAAGFASGIVAGLLGVGGGTILVPVLVFLDRSTHTAIGTSSLAMIITTFSGSVQNWRTGQLRMSEALPVAVSAAVAAQFGALAAEHTPSRGLALAFAGLLMVSLGLMILRQKLAQTERPPRESILLRAATGLIGGFLSGLFGVGGGVIMVPLLMLFLGDSIHHAVRVSLAVIVLTAASGALGHAWHGNLDIMAGLILGCGGLLGAQIGTRLLPRFPQRALRAGFLGFTLLLAGALIWKATLGDLH